LINNPKITSRMESLNELATILSEINNPSELEVLLKEILTPKERSDLVLRWQLMKELYAGETQRKIASRHKISLCKITRGSKILKKNESVSLEILKELYPDKKII
jgi:Trp operon repressor